MASSTETVIAIYRVRADSLDAFLDLLAGHHPTLVRLGLATETRPTVYVGEEDGPDGGPIVFEIFDWVDAQAVQTAHESPEVMRVWEAIGAMVEKRGGKPEFEFPHVEKRELPHPDA